MPSRALAQADQFTIGDGQQAGLDTLHRMRQIVRAQVAAPLVRLTTAAICRGTGTDSQHQIYLIRQWITSRVGFLRDPNGHELLHTPDLVMQLIRDNGTCDVDCDDVAMLAAAMGMSIGLRAQFQMIGEFGGYSHVWTDLGAPFNITEWVDLDITRPFQVDMSRYPMQLAVEV
jgi:hypothetical protein